jgi:eukaryotic-like serine/threonine-protein kinase
VTAQKPLPNKKVGRGSKLRINVSTGSASTPGTTTSGRTTTTAARTVTVPNVVGLQQTVAQRRLNSAGLGSRVRYVSSQKPSGQVVAQGPAAGATANKGSKVQLSVSVGPSATTTQVPNVVGQDQQTATSTLQNAGFKVQVIMVPSSDPSQNGTVVDEQPAGGTRAPDGSTVTIYVGSSG